MSSSRFHTGWSIYIHHRFIFFGLVFFCFGCLPEHPKGSEETLNHFLPQDAGIHIVIKNPVEQLVDGRLSEFKEKIEKQLSEEDRVVFQYILDHQLTDQTCELWLSEMVVQEDERKWVFSFSADYTEKSDSFQKGKNKPDFFIRKEKNKTQISRSENILNQTTEKNSHKQNVFSQLYCLSKSDKDILVFINHRYHPSLQSHFLLKAKAKPTHNSWTVVDWEKNGEDIYFSGISKTKQKNDQTKKYSLSSALALIPSDIYAFEIFSQAPYPFLISGQNDSISEEEMLYSNPFFNLYQNNGELSAMLIITSEYEAMNELNENSEMINSNEEYSVWKVQNPKTVINNFPLNWNSAFFSQKDNFILLSNTKQTLHSILNSIKKKTTITKNDELNDFFNEFPNFFDSFLFIRNRSMGSFIDLVFNRQQTIDNNKNNFIGIQISKETNFELIQGFVKGSNASRKSAHLLWSSTINHPPKGNPFLIKNHRSGNWNMVMQDKQNTLHLIDHKGKHQWAKPLDGAIFGEIYQVDMFRNRKLQLVFNTKKKLYVLDIFGNSVSPFPISLKKEASAGLGLFDYDKKRKYRLAIPSGKSIQMFDQRGKKVSGFSFSGASAIEITPKHFRIRSKDYIVFQDNLGNPYFLHRTGKVRVLPKPSPKLSDSPIFKDSRSSPGWLALTQEGTLVHIGTNGSTFEKKKNVRKKVQRFFVSNGDRFTFYNGVIKRSGNRNFTTLENYKNSIVGFSKVDNTVFTTVLDTLLNETTILNSEGIEMKGFPVEGSAGVAIGVYGNKKPYIVIVTEKNGTIRAYSLARE